MRLISTACSARQYCITKNRNQTDSLFNFNWYHISLVKHVFGLFDSNMAEGLDRNFYFEELEINEIEERA